MSASLGSSVQISVNLSRSSTLSRLALAMLLPSLSWSCADRPDEVASGAVQSARARGPSGGYNQRDLDIARPYGGRARAEVARALEGSVDIHMHTHPDVVERPVDAFEAVDLALAYGLRAVVLKNHYEPTAAQANLVRDVTTGLEVFGGITMDLTNGGVNPAAVEHMANLEGGFGRVVWMPPVSSNGELLPETKAVISVIAEHGLVLATGHLSGEEGLMLVREGRRQGVEHMVVTHAMDSGWTVPQMQEAARMGAFIEFAKPLGSITVDQYAQGIRMVGPQFCILSQLTPSLGSRGRLRRSAARARLHGTRTRPHDEGQPRAPAGTSDSVSSEIIGCIRHSFGR